MASINSLNISSFNCTGIKSSLEYLSEHLCPKYNILVLQELWILPHEVDVVSNIHSEYNGFAKSAVDVESGVLRGRPYGGLGFLWHQSLDAHVTPMPLEDNRLLALKITDDNYSIMLINVYMPTQSSEHYDEFIRLLGKISSIIQSDNVDSFCIIGDFNANTGSRFFKEMENFCTSNHFVVADVAALPPSTYTFLSEAHGTTSWLDHVCVSENVVEHVRNFEVMYGGGTSGHFPIGFSLNLPTYFKATEAPINNETVVKWDFHNQEKVARFKVLLEQNLNNIESSFCYENNCNSVNCRREINDYYLQIQQAIHKAGEEVFSVRRERKTKIIPGWNHHVKEHHMRARDSFLLWRSLGSPREGEAAERMRADRARFKLALRECRASEARLREEALAAKLTAGDSAGYWRNIKKLNQKTKNYSAKLDHVAGDENIVDLWKCKYQQLFNSVDKASRHDDLLSMKDNSEFVRVQEVQGYIKKLSTGKATGKDGIPAEVYKLGPHRLIVLITVFLNACLQHCFIPDLVMRVILVPLLKSKLKPACDSDNYRPIAIATSISKIFELHILAKCTQLLYTSDNQFGFKRKHSTDICIFVLKDILNYFNRLGSPVHTVFVDLRKAYDRINHSKLFRKLLNRGVPLYIVKFIAYWYSHQQIQVRWAHHHSDAFTVTNGIRQGGLISAALFNLYLDDLSTQLNSSRVGCRIGSVIVSHLAYADGIVLIAPSPKALNLLLYICDQYARAFDTIFSTEKTLCMIFWPKR